MDLINVPLPPCLESFWGFIKHGPRDGCPQANLLLLNGGGLNVFIYLPLIISACFDHN